MTQQHAQKDSVGRFLNGENGTLLAEFAEVETGKRTDRLIVDHWPEPRLLQVAMRLVVIVEALERVIVLAKKLARLHVLDVPIAE